MVGPNSLESLGRCPQASARLLIDIEILQQVDAMTLNVEDPPPGRVAGAAIIRHADASPCFGSLHVTHKTRSLPASDGHH